MAGKWCIGTVGICVSMWEERISQAQVLTPLHNLSFAAKSLNSKSHFVLCIALSLAAWHEKRAFSPSHGAHK